jgi:hypothetical protein
MLEHWFVSDLTVVGTTRDAYGELVYANQSTTKGRILDHGAIILNDQKEEMLTDAIAWVAPTETVTTDTVLKYSGDYFRIIKIVRARRGGSTDVQFLKCYLQKYNAMAGIS